MQITLNTVSPKYNLYNNQNTPRYNQQPSFGSATELADRFTRKSKVSKFLTRPIKAIKDGYEGLGEGAAKHIIPKVFDNKFFDKCTEHFKDTDNLFKHFLTVGSLITSGMYMYKTLTNDKLDQDRKNTLAVNQFLTFALATAGAYALDGYLADWWQKQTAKYASAALEDKTIYKDFVEEFKKNKQEIKEIKAYNKTVSKAEQKEISVLKAEKFIKERAKNVLVDKKDLAQFMDRVKGMGLLKSMLVFALVYRYIVPVAVTKPANILCDKYLANKKAKEAEKMQNTESSKS